MRMANKSSIQILDEQSRGELKRALTTPLTKKEVAEQIGVSAVTISNWIEGGPISRVGIERLLEWAKKYSKRSPKSKTETKTSI